MANGHKPNCETKSVCFSYGPKPTNDIKGAFGFNDGPKPTKNKCVMFYFDKLYLTRVNIAPVIKHLN